ncbi:hypothetical protein DS901_07045 [Loktanella sp. D2R18]|uniref:hypothetical protein n=1 Tax=Rhodobacterales TaxID=204455 RepID=UPI000DE9FA12|nr:MULTISPECIES: hypothetical protein [Rhodobacterales]MDO6589525.1 hypothetical protein [Yoonia sp. 1_MG-2023]RBW44171.1 hypothetical protein DS901_07045 [Loktanella sp. D2R18]
MYHSNTALVVDFPRSTSRPKTIVIGDVARWQAQGMNVAPMDGLRFVAIDAICADTLVEFAPETIFSPLIADTFDALEVAQFLATSAYSGRYCAISDPLPDREGVIAEISKHAPGIWFDIFVVPI